MGFVTRKARLYELSGDENGMMLLHMKSSCNVINDGRCDIRPFIRRIFCVLNPDTFGASFYCCVKSAIPLCIRTLYEPQRETVIGTGLNVYVWRSAPACSSLL